MLFGSRSIIGKAGEFMQKLRIKDEVIVVAGKDKNKTGTILKIDWKNEKVLVQGLNIVKKAKKPSQQDPTSGFFEIEKPIHISNVMVVSPKTKKATRVRIEEKEGKRRRVAITCGTVLDK